ALAHSEAGLQREAFTTLQQVLARDPDNAKALELLGLVELRLHHWPHARDADFWDALWNLGLKAAEAKRVDVALPALRRFAAEAPAARYGADRERARELAAQLTAERR